MDESPAITDDSIKVIQSTLQTLTDARQNKTYDAKSIKSIEDALINLNKQPYWRWYNRLDEMDPLSKDLLDKIKNKEDGISYAISQLQSSINIQAMKNIQKQQQQGGRKKRRKTKRKKKNRKKSTRRRKRRRKRKTKRKKRRSKTRK